MNIVAGISEDIGMRSAMEDEHAIYERPDLSFFSAEVYDGHLGIEAARLASEMLTPHFLNALSTESEKRAYDRVPVEEMLREAFVAIDNYIVYQRIRSGAAAALLYIMGDRFLAANAGDSRVVMGTESGVMPLTLDHKPDIPEERARIEALGGKVTRIGVPRVMGLLAMSRALGDAELKPLVTCEPRITAGLLGRENDYAVVACDGVWDVLSPEAVMDIVRHSGNVQKGADAVRDAARQQGSSDNVTVIVLDLTRHTRLCSRGWMEISLVFDKGLTLLNRDAAH